MAVITVRALLRDAAAVFDRLETDQEPVVVTRHGHPVAALVPIDQDHAEAMILSAAPELIESRRRAANARAEGRTIPLSNALQNLDVEQLSQDREQVAIPGSHSEQAEDPLVQSLAELTYLVGASLAAEVTETATRRVDEITRQAVSAASAGGVLEEGEPREQLLGRIHRLNARLLGLSFRHELLSDALERVTAVSAGAPVAAQISHPAEGLLGKSLTDEALGAASAYVGSINADLIARSRGGSGKLSPELYEASLSGCVTALERADARRQVRVGQKGKVSIGALRYSKYRYNTIKKGKRREASYLSSEITTKKSRAQLYVEARKLSIRGRSSMAKDELARAVAKARGKK
jgi:prevent-host-death family protein